jgi:hypothetical protein
VASHGNSRVWDRRTACHSTRRSPARPKQEPHPYSPVSVRAVASGAGSKQAASKAPLRATSPKSQPPHLVLDSHNNYHYNPNLSFDHLLPGVIADYYEIDEHVNPVEYSVLRMLVPYFVVRLSGVAETSVASCDWNSPPIFFNRASIFPAC